MCFMAYTRLHHTRVQIGDEAASQSLHIRNRSSVLNYQAAYSGAHIVPEGSREIA